jgi:Fe-S cluster assembly scaffold protein SufB
MSRERLSKQIEPGEKEYIASVGIDLSEEARSASFLQKDHSLAFHGSGFEGVEIMDIREALKSEASAKEHYGQAFALLKREYPQDTEGGYFIRVKKGAMVELPIQACLFLKSQGFRQKVHNVIIIEEGARAFIITGCASSAAAKEGFHLGVSEFFLGKGAFLNFTMIHSWREDVSVKPIGISVLEDNATLVSNYICLKPVKDITMYPTAVLSGKDSRVSFNSLILSHPGSTHDIGSRALLRAPGAQAESVARAVSFGGKVTSRGHIKASCPGVKGHLECRGLMLSEQGYIYAIP